MRARGPVGTGRNVSERGPMGIDGPEEGRVECTRGPVGMDRRSLEGPVGMEGDVEGLG